MENEYANFTKLLGAIDNGDLDRAEEALRSGLDPNIKEVLSGVTPLQIAAAMGDVAMLELLISHGADVNLRSGDVDMSALESAAIAGRVEAVKWLVQHGAALPTGRVKDTLIEDLVQFGEHAIIALISNPD